MFVYDDVLADPMAYRAAVLARPFGTVPFGPEITFHGIQVAEDPTFLIWIGQQFPALVPTLSFFRQSPRGQVEPNYVHTDRDMGDWTAILYLVPNPPFGDGTEFWKHRATGADRSLAIDAESQLDEQHAWADPAQWELLLHVPAKFGRALLFPSNQFHSRAIPENYGTGEDARLIQVVFGIGTLGKD
jgi:Family of unknown function (DUF6445)